MSKLIKIEVFTHVLPVILSEAKDVKSVLIREICVSYENNKSCDGRSDQRIEGRQ